MCAQLRYSPRGRAAVHERHCRAWHSFAAQVLRSLVTAPVCALGKRTGSDPGSTACEAAGDVDARPRLRPHPGLPSLGAPLAPVGAGARMDSRFEYTFRIGPVGAGPSACPGRVAEKTVPCTFKAEGGFGGFSRTRGAHSHRKGEPQGPPLAEGKAASR